MCVSCQFLVKVVCICTPFFLSLISQSQYHPNRREIASKSQDSPKYPNEGPYVSLCGSSKTPSLIPGGTGKEARESSSRITPTIFPFPSKTVLLRPRMDLITGKALLQRQSHLMKLLPSETTVPSMPLTLMNSLSSSASNPKNVTVALPGSRHFFLPARSLSSEAPAAFLPPSPSFMNLSGVDEGKSPSIPFRKVLLLPSSLSLPFSSVSNSCRLREAVSLALTGSLHSSLELSLLLFLRICQCAFLFFFSANKQMTSQQSGFLCFGFF